MRSRQLVRGQAGHRWGAVTTAAARAFIDVEPAVERGLVGMIDRLIQRRIRIIVGLVQLIVWLLVVLLRLATWLVRWYKGTLPA